jgi:hypothetical protein
VINYQLSVVCCLLSVESFLRYRLLGLLTHANFLARLHFVSNPRQLPRMGTHEHCFTCRKWRCHFYSLALFPFFSGLYMLFANIHPFNHNPSKRGKRTEYGTPLSFVLSGYNFDFIAFLELHRKKVL